MEKRVLLAVVLSFVVLYGYQAMFPPPPPPGVESPPSQQGPTQSPASTEPAAKQAESQPAPRDSAPTPPALEAQPIASAAAEQDIVVESPAVHAVFTTRGGALKSWRLKLYSDGNGQPLDLVPTRAPAGALRPFTLGA